MKTVGDFPARLCALGRRKCFRHSPYGKKRIDISFAASSKDERLVNELFEGKAQLRDRRENECVYSLPVYSLEEAASNLLNIQRGVIILHPEELRGIYLAKARAMAGAIAKKNKK